MTTRAALSAGARVAYDGQRCEIAELSPPSVLLSGPAGELRRVSISHLVAADSAVIARPGSGDDGPDTGAALSGLDSGELARLRERVGHVRVAVFGAASRRWRRSRGARGLWQGACLSGAELAQQVGGGLVGDAELVARLYR